MTKNKKLTIIIAAALLVIAGIATIATTQPNKTPTPPIAPAVTQSSEPASSEAEKVVAPDIVITEKTESKPTSSEVKTLPVEGDPEAKPTESKPFSSKPAKPAEKPTSSVKPTPVTPVEKPTPAVSSQPPTDNNVDIPTVGEFPQNPKEGEHVIKDGAYWDYSNGRWWEGEDVDAKWVDDSDKIVLCPLCGKIGRECECPPVGH